MKAGATTPLTLLGSGKVGIGTTSPQRLLHVYSGSAGADPTWSTDDIAIYENSTNSVIQLFSPTNYGS